jgi:hypothetical protein
MIRRSTPHTPTAAKLPARADAMLIGYHTDVLRIGDGSRLWWRLRTEAYEIIGEVGG